ncbi:MAG: adenosine deaminase [Deltaproteobacteria bacterium]|nr:MAG: adenosine deaminase [Deltaproteobacteria bacterium]
MDGLLVCSLGTSWAVIPEALCLLRPDIADLYARHRDAERLAALRADIGVRPAELWVVTTAATKTGELAAWLSATRAPIATRVWRCAAARDLRGAEECRAMAELTFRVLLLATSRARDDRVVVSLAGGRKTMSADLQRAATVFGARALLHVVGGESLPSRVEDLAGPLAETFDVTPVCVGRGRRAELVDADFDGDGPLAPGAFPLPLPEPDAPRAIAEATWEPPRDGRWLVDAVDRREAAAGEIAVNAVRAIRREGPLPAWRSLMRLPPRQVEALRATPVTAAHEAALRALPKAELHCHVGGCLDVTAQRAVADAIWDAATARERERASERAEPLVAAVARGEPWPDDWPSVLRGDAADPDARRLRATASARVLRAVGADELAVRLYGDGEWVALQQEDAFATYERAGDLSGSALLGHPAAVGEYGRQIGRWMAAEGVRYLELRCSPHKYGRRGEAAREFFDELHAAIAGAAGAADVRFVWIIDRRAGASAAEVVDEAVRMPRERVVGLDLAGDELRAAASELADAFGPAHEACMPLTIHAGELHADDARAVWQAIYALHADRVGHGLTLAADAGLCRKVADRSVCVELCPTSNRQVVGYFDPDIAATRGRAGYPLHALRDAGVPIAICTDNPGISRTSPARERVVASRMAARPLSLWDVLAIEHDAFAHAFLPARERARLIDDAEPEVLAWAASIA